MSDITWSKLGIDYSKQDRVAQFEIETDSLHNFKELYKRIYDWLLFEDYHNIQTDEHKKLSESLLFIDVRR